MKLKLIALTIGLLLTSCNLTVSPDGTRHWSLNGEAAKAVVIYATK